MRGGRFSLSAPAPRARPESIVPMINIVFLLLIFFMLSATIAPPDPFDLALPEGAAGTPEGGPRTLILALGPLGEMAHAGAEGAAALARLVADYRPGDRVVLRADGGLDGAVFAGLLADLAGRGIADITLAVRR